MCVAIYKPKGIVLSNEKDMQLAFKKNPHGAGFAWKSGDRRISLRKGFFSFEALWDAWQAVQEKEAILHFRHASMGEINKDNCHPFVLKNFGVVIHNGHFSGYGTKEVSDTRQWLETVLAPLLERFPKALESPEIFLLLEEACASSKLVILPFRSEGVIINEVLGHWEENVWYSNITYRTVYMPPKEYTYGTYSMNGKIIDPPVAKADKEPWWAYLHGRVNDTNKCEVCGEQAKWSVCDDCLIAEKLTEHGKINGDLPAQSYADMWD